ncbi:MAG: hypothetical protein LUC24_04960 [Bacteroidales bacterium]|nr:hypothetical protein [Bacteroidales bacterium]MCD8313492.1 hypothetical protein [Bacteroidales bacterium]
MIKRVIIGALSVVIFGILGFAVGVIVNFPREQSGVNEMSDKIGYVYSFESIPSGRFNNFLHGNLGRRFMIDAMKRDIYLWIWAGTKYPEFAHCEQNCDIFAIYFSDKTQLAKLEKDIDRLAEFKRELSEPDDYEIEQKNLLKKFILMGEEKIKANKRAANFSSGFVGCAGVGPSLEECLMQMNGKSCEELDDLVYGKCEMTSKTASDNEGNFTVLYLLPHEKILSADVKAPQGICKNIKLQSFDKLEIGRDYAWKITWSGAE